MPPSGDWLAADVGIVRRLVPGAARRGVRAQGARLRAWRLERDLAGLASGTHTIVVGPWLGEVGFEVLYWIPFLAWFAERFNVDPQRLLIVSRGGTAAWYRSFAARYREILDHMSPEEFRRRHDERVAINGEQKQTRVLSFEHDLLSTLTTDVQHRRMLHPSTMFSLFAPYWWGHMDESWVHRRARYRHLGAPACYDALRPADPYVAVKFYFNECFPPTAANQQFVRDVLGRLVAAGPVVSLTTTLTLDDHGAVDPRELGVRPLPPQLDVRENLAAQSAIVAGASCFVGTYGGFSYLAPFYGVRSLVYYGDPHGYSARHLRMARSALRTIGAGDLLDVRPIPADGVVPLIP